MLSWTSSKWTFLLTRIYLKINRHPQGEYSQHICMIRIWLQNREIFLQSIIKENLGARTVGCLPCAWLTQDRLRLDSRHPRWCPKLGVTPECHQLGPKTKTKTNKQENLMKNLNIFCKKGDLLIVHELKKVLNSLDIRKCNCGHNTMLYDIRLNLQNVALNMGR